MIFCDFQILLKNHPFHDIEHMVIGGTTQAYIGHGQETCTIELSHTMNKSGLRIPDDLPMSPLLAEGKVRSTKAANGDNYIFSVVDMSVYLSKTYPPVDNYKAGDRAGFVKQLGSRKGIIALGQRHISLWDGQHYVHEDKFFNLWSGPYAASAIKRGIFFWEVKSFADELKDMYGF